MPLTLVNKDMIPSARVTNDPGQIIEVENVAGSIHEALGYVNPPNFAPAFDNNIASLIQNTLTQAGANDAALGDVRPTTPPAIIAVREAATMPMQTVQNRFYSFVEDVARIWADMWVSLYGKRALKIEDANGVWYLPFDGEKYRRLLISARIDVGASSMWSEIQSVKTLDNLFAQQIITPRQYLERLPKGTVPDVGGLLRDMNVPAQAQGEPSAHEEGPGPENGAAFSTSGRRPLEADSTPPWWRRCPRNISRRLAALPPEQQAALLARTGPGIQIRKDESTL